MFLTSLLKYALTFWPCLAQLKLIEKLAYQQVSAAVLLAAGQRILS
jgi:hypothetical protein